MFGRYSHEIEAEPASGEREVTLNAPLILGIFFTLALLCGIFFAIGYSLGHRRTQPDVASSAAKSGTEDQPADQASTEPPADTSSSPTPAATGSPAAESAGQTVTVPLSSAAHPAQVPAPRTPRPATPAVPAKTAPAAAPAGPLLVVQVAALSHEEDAVYLRTLLEKRGYHVAIVRAPQDRLLRVQVGPFTNHKDADATRQKLIKEGYNPIVK